MQTMQTMEKNRLQQLPKTLHSTINPMIKAFKKQIEKIEALILALIEKRPIIHGKRMNVPVIQGFRAPYLSSFHPSRSAFAYAGCHLSH